VTWRGSSFQTMEEVSYTRKYKLYLLARKYDMWISYIRASVYN